MRRIGLLLVLTAYCITPAAAEEPLAARVDVDFFEAKVRPLLVERCQGCHSTRAKKSRGGLRLDSRAALLKGGDTGPALVPGEPDKSLLIKAIRYQDKSLHMPPKGKLPERELAILEEWVRKGAVFPGSAEAATGRATINLAEGRKFWSFQPPRVLPVPVPRDTAWSKRPSDAFVLVELEKRNLGPSPPASRRVLIRRATFDLIGLPPSPEEVEAFVNDPAPDAWAKRIDRLLAAPQYGERWGRHWLDLTRYCDVAESWLENKGAPYLYRDWVVRAINDDLPYDQFVQRQLAADLMPEARPADRAALGFLGLSPTYWKELKLDPDVIKTVVAEEWEERIQAVSGTVLGLTVACARCHDHKFDPITTQDYYALAGVFASTRQADRALLPDARAADVRQVRQRVSELQGQIDKLQAKKPLPAETVTQVEELRAQIEVLKSTPDYDAPTVPGVEDASLHVLPDGPYRTKLEYRAGEPQDVCMQVRGNPANPVRVVPRRFLAVLSPEPVPTFRQGSGRRELARAMVTEGAPLAARVIVNRVWKHHFGSGLVETPSDFGAQGARPSHPQLLDDLTARFLAHGWSLKWLHREIMLSAAYQQASAPDTRKQAVDPDNRWLWRMNRRRLEVEPWRDAMLAVSGTLSLELGGPALDLSDPKNRRRTIYGIVKRRELNDLLRLHDFPDPTTHSAMRVPTTTPLQQLFTLNGPLMQQQATALVRRLKADVPDGDAARVRQAYRLLYGRAATEGQVKRAMEFLTAGKDKAPVSDAMWEQYAQVLLGSNEFAFID